MLKTAFFETQCAVETNLGIKQTCTIKNGCTGAVQTEVITQTHLLRKSDLLIGFSIPDEIIYFVKFMYTEMNNIKES